MNYECPKCQSQLKYWEEFVITKERTVNKLTGKLNKKSVKTKEVEIEPHGLVCTGNDCGFEYNGNFVANQDNYPQLDSIFEKMM